MSDLKCGEQESKKNITLLEAMPCNCGRKRQGGDVPSELSAPLLVQEPAEWGPTLWTYLHILTERLGASGSPIVDTDQANYMELLLQQLPDILPCNECQQHAIQYISEHPVPNLKGLYREVLRTTVRNWLFAFHQDVRIRKEQPLLLASPEDCVPLYRDRTLSKADYNKFIQTITAAIRQGWIRLDHWRKWYSHSEKMRILSGNIVI